MIPHDGQPLAADEPDHHHHRPPGVATAHTRALVTWVAIFPLAALGMSLLAHLAPEWPVLLKALVLTAVVVPVTVYLTVPRLLVLVLAVSARRRRVSDPGTHHPRNAFHVPVPGEER